MTTSSSPIAKLKAQADKIAATLKAAERGDPVYASLAARVAAARSSKSSFKVGVVMDDKAFAIELTCEKIQETTEAALAEYILDLMRGTRGPIQ